MAKGKTKPTVAKTGVRKATAKEIAVQEEAQAKQPTAPETPAIPVVFKCNLCGADKPIEEMKVLTTYFPPLVVCRDCEKAQ